MQGKKRLEEIKRRLQGVLKNVNPADIERYDIEFEPAKTIKGYQHINGYAIRTGDSPAYEFYLVDKTQPNKAYRVMYVVWPDIAKPTPPDEEKYLGGSALESNIRKGIGALSKSKKDKKRREENPGGLEKTTMIIALTSLVLAIIFLSPNLTGNVIGNMTDSTSNIIGAVFLVIGLVGGFFWFRRR